MLNKCNLPDAHRGWLDPRRLLHLLSRLSSSVGRSSQRTTVRSRAARIWSAVLFSGMSVVLMGNDGCIGCPGNPRVSLPNAILQGWFQGLVGAAPHMGAPAADARPKLTGTDGSQTGLAAFLGNFTTITEPDQSYFFFVRQPDCSLLQVTGTSGLAGSASYTSSTSNYERTLHQLAQLTSKPDVFANGCVERTLGITSRAAIFAGITTSGVAVMATAQGNGNNDAVFVLTTNSSFQPVSFQSIASLTAATALAAGDFNGDGNKDLLVVNDYNATSSYVSVLLGNADGSFQTPVNYPIAGAMSVAAVVDDINGDGKEDVIAASDDQHLSVLLGKGDGTFAAAQSFSVAVTGTTLTSLITADLRGNGKKDIICSNGMVLLGNGDGTFTPVSGAAFPPTQNLTSGIPLGMASGDVNNDGKTDLVISTGVNIGVWLGKGDGTFTQGLSYPSINNSGYVTVTDLDGDGNMDIYSGLANGGLFSGDDSSPASAYVLMGNGDGTFQGAGSTLLTYTGNNLGDVNGDGQQDLISLNPAASGYTGTFLVGLGTPKGSFNPVSTITPPASFTLGGQTITGANVGAGAYAVADINGDGKADLVIQDENLSSTNPVSNQPIVYPNPVYFTSLSNGDGTFAAPVPQVVPQIAPAADYDISLSVGNLELADFNHDGKADQIYVYNEVEGGTGITNPYNQGIAVLLGNGNGTFQTTPILTSTYSSANAPTTGAVPQIVSTTDINGDGKPDLLVISSTFSVATGAVTQVQVLLGNGDGSFKAPTTVTTPANVYGKPVLVDVNADGKLDLAVLCEDNNSQAELVTALGNGDGTFATAVSQNLTGGDSIRSGSLAAADFDGDGKVDLGLLDYSGYSGIFYGKGDGTFTSVPISGGIVPKDLLNLFVGGTAAAALDLNKDGKPDILTGSTILLNLYGDIPAVTGSTATTVAVTAAPATTVAPGTNVTFTATITPAAGSTGSPTGTVMFLDGTTTLGTGTVSANAATYSTSTLAAGAHSITAVYAGDANFAGSTSPVLTETVSTSVVATTTTLAASPASAAAGASVAFTAQVAPASGTAIPTGMVTFTDGSTTLGMAALDGTGAAVYTTSTLAVGAHSVVAAYAGVAPFTGSTSTAVSVTITAAVPADFSLGLSPATSTVSGGSSASTTLSVTPAGGFNQATTVTCSGAPTGATCTIATPTVTPSGSAAATTMVTLQTTAANAALSGFERRLQLAATLPLGLIGASALLGAGRRRRWQLAASLTFCALATAGCGGASKTATPSSQVYTITLTGTSGSLSHTATWTVTVQ